MAPGLSGDNTQPSPQSSGLAQATPCSKGSKGVFRPGPQSETTLGFCCWSLVLRIERHWLHMLSPRTKRLHKLPKLDLVAQAVQISIG